ncbi:MAG: hypothetical protein EBX68_06860 [Betaproteobacteria bacterium]|nr:hypothetical protein [Betaproteobacteria bacterium]
MLPSDLKFKLLYFDVETASFEPSLEDLETKNPRLASLWSKRSIYYRSAYPELSEASDAEIYSQKAALEPEFCRVVCVSFGMMEDNTEVRKVSFYGEDEVDILNKTNKIFKNSIAKNWKLCGHNIKGFDVPCLGKRMLYNGISPSSNIQMWDKKPWETPLVDTRSINADSPKCPSAWPQSTSEIRCSRLKCAQTSKTRLSSASITVGR